MLVVASRDRDDPVVSSAIDRLQKAGFQTTDDADRAVSRVLAADPPGAFVVTRSVFFDVPASDWRDLYGRGDIVGGLDVSLYELRPRADPLGSTGSARLRYTPEQPIFSLMFSKACRTGAMSDWLDGWDLAGVIDMRLAELAATKGC
jgi:hypothetical protein